jgi:hypothetical protein
MPGAGERQYKAFDGALQQNRTGAGHMGQIAMARPWQLSHDLSISEAPLAFLGMQSGRRTT